MVDSNKADSEVQKQVLEELKGLKREVGRFNDRFTHYQNSTLWVVQLAFALIASATITLIITAVLKR